MFSFLDHYVFIFGSLCFHFWIIVFIFESLFSFLDHYVFIFESLCFHFWIIMFSFLNHFFHFWIIMFSFLDHYVFIFGSLFSFLNHCFHFWIIMFSFLDHYVFIFGSLCFHFWIIITRVHYGYGLYLMFIPLYTSQRHSSSWHTCCHPPRMDTACLSSPAIYI